MNVNDVDSRVVESGEDRLKLIFERQKELMEKYHDIEKANGLLQTPDVPVDLHDRRGQARIKDFAWRITEELAEAVWASEELAEEGPEWDRVHVQEEVADALHFLVELAILAGVGPVRIIREFPQFIEPGRDSLNSLYNKARHTTHCSHTPEESFTKFIAQLGMVCHLLKNKPWKQSQMLTDIQMLEKRLSWAFVKFMAFCISINLDPDKLFDLYYRKSEVNKFRQRSNY